VTKLFFAEKFNRERAQRENPLSPAAEASKPPTQYGVELWSSDDNRELHTFKLDGSAAGYSYVLGFDPDMIMPALVVEFLVACGHSGAADAIIARLLRDRKERP